MRRQKLIGRPLMESPKTAEGWVTAPPRTERNFVKLWLSALSENWKQHENMKEFTGLWERDAAIADLMRNNSPFYVRVVQTVTRGCKKRGCKKKKNVNDGSKLLEPNLEFQSFLWRELRVYGRHLNRVVAINRNWDVISKQLASAYSSSSRIALKSTVKGFMDPFLDELFDLEHRFTQFAENYWEMVYCTGPFATQPGDPSLSADPKMRQLSDSLKLPDLRQERNLDTIFQVRVGDLLRKYGSNPFGTRLSLLTISRLVLLVYICAGLVDRDLTIWSSDPPRTVSVQTTYEKLRDAGLR
jgi:hypothetical protein